jgi:hypothetical protein
VKGCEMTHSQMITGFFGVPLTKKAAGVIWCRTIRAVLRYIYRLLAVYVSLLANIPVF